MKRIILKYTLWIAVLFFSFHTYALTTDDPLPSWNEGPIKQKLIQFVESVTNTSNSNFVKPENRIAALDNDGTLWVEQPLYTQYIFTLDRIKQLAPQHLEWTEEEPFKSVLNDQVDNLSRSDYEKIFAETQAGLSVEDYHKIASGWLASAVDKHFKKHYTDLVYVPMLELIRYLHDNHFKVFIVTGGGQDFVRVFSEDVYTIPRERVIGTVAKTKFIYKDQQPQLMKLSDILFVDNYAGKVQGIDLFIGKKPILAVGNSDGDKEMLEWTQSGPGKRLMMLVHHDDAEREYAYDTESKVGTFSKALMDEAHKKGWQIISMKNDWRKIFSFDKEPESESVKDSESNDSDESTESIETSGTKSSKASGTVDSNSNEPVQSNTTEPVE